MFSRKPLKKFLRAKSAALDRCFGQPLFDAHRANIITQIPAERLGSATHFELVHKAEPAPGSPREVTLRVDPTSTVMIDVTALDPARRYPLDFLWCDIAKASKLQKPNYLQSITRSRPDISH